jgi:hypothetical protein
VQRREMQAWRSIMQTTINNPNVTSFCYEIIYLVFFFNGFCSTTCYENFFTLLLPCLPTSCERLVNDLLHARFLTQQTCYKSLQLSSSCNSTTC